MAATEDPPAPHGAVEDSEDDDDDEDDDDEVGRHIATRSSKCCEIVVFFHWLGSKIVSKSLEASRIVNECIKCRVVREV